jgi:myo-inositol-1-phosphate synthase
MTNTDRPQKGVLLLIAGIKGAIGSTVAAASAIIQNQPEAVLPYLITGEKFPFLGAPRQMAVAGWDTDSGSFERALDGCGVLEKNLWELCLPELNKIAVRPAPDAGMGVKEQVAQVKADMAAFQNQHPGLVPVFVNLLPAGVCHDLRGVSTLEQLYETDARVPADIVYAAAAVESGIAVINFTPNDVEIPALVSAAAAAGVPLAGKDGKTGQTYFKVVLASSLLARRLHVNGWYSLNILGNADGENLMDPQHAACKLDNKTGVLEEVLGYAPGEKRHNRSAHKVHIDYYPPRGDAKEAWDVIDFEGIFGMPMSMRINLQGRDSILAAPMVMDLARWMAALTLAGRSGPIPELAFFFKKSVGQDGPIGFEKQMAALEKLEKEICP